MEPQVIAIPTNFTESGKILGLHMLMDNDSYLKIAFDMNIRPENVPTRVEKIRARARALVAA